MKKVTQTGECHVKTHAEERWPREDKTEATIKLLQVGGHLGLPHQKLNEAKKVFF